MTNSPIADEDSYAGEVLPNEHSSTEEGRTAEPLFLLTKATVWEYAQTANGTGTWIIFPIGQLTSIENGEILYPHPLVGTFYADNGFIDKARRGNKWSATIHPIELTALEIALSDTPFLADTELPIDKAREIANEIFHTFVSVCVVREIRAYKTTSNPAEFEDTLFKLFEESNGFINQEIVIESLKRYRNKAKSSKLSEDMIQNFAMRYAYIFNIAKYYFNECPWVK